MGWGVDLEHRQGKTSFSSGPGEVVWGPLAWGREVESGVANPFDEISLSSCRESRLFLG